MDAGGTSPPLSCSGTSWRRIDRVSVLRAANSTRPSELIASAHEEETCKAEQTSEACQTRKAQEVDCAGQLQQQKSGIRCSRLSGATASCGERSAHCPHVRHTSLLLGKGSSRCQASMKVVAVDDATHVEEARCLVTTFHSGRDWFSTTFSRCTSRCDARKSGMTNTHSCCFPAENLRRLQRCSSRLSISVMHKAQ